MVINPRHLSVLYLEYSEKILAFWLYFCFKAPTFLSLDYLFKTDGKWSLTNFFSCWVFYHLMYFPPRLKSSFPFMWTIAGIFFSVEISSLIFHFPFSTANPHFANYLEQQSFFYFGKNLGISLVLSLLYYSLPIVTFHSGDLLFFSSLNFSIHSIFQSSLNTAMNEHAFLPFSGKCFWDHI